MLSALVPSLMAEAIISLANWPCESASGEAALYSSLRGNGMKTILTAGTPRRSTLKNLPKPSILPSVSRIW